MLAQYFKMINGVTCHCLLCLDNFYYIYLNITNFIGHYMIFLLASHYQNNFNIYYFKYQFKIKNTFIIKHILFTSQYNTIKSLDLQITKKWINNFIYQRHTTTAYFIVYFHGNMYILYNSFYYYFLLFNNCYQSLLNIFNL